MVARREPGGYSTHPALSPDGRFLAYATNARDDPFGANGRPRFDVTRDGQRVLVVLEVRQPRTVATLIENWQVEPAEDDRR